MISELMVARAQLGSRINLDTAGKVQCWLSSLCRFWWC